MLVSKVNFSSINYMPSFYSKKDKKDSANSEKSDSYNDFDVWQSQVGFLNKIDLVGSLIKEDEEGRVYSINGTNKWTIRQYKNAPVIPGTLKKTRIQEVKDLSPDINIGQTIARIEQPNSKSYSQLLFVQKNVEGNSIGVPAELADKAYEANVDRHIESLRLLSDVPQESYDELVGNILKMAKKGYDIQAEKQDSIVYDSIRKKFNFTNVRTNSLFNSFKEPEQMKNAGEQYGDVLYTLLGGDFALKYAKDSNHRSENDEGRMLTNTVYLKYRCAMAKNACHYTNSENIQKLLKTDLLDTMLQTHIYELKYKELNNTSNY